MEAIVKIRDEKMSFSKVAELYSEDKAKQGGIKRNITIIC